MSDESDQDQQDVKPPLEENGDAAAKAKRGRKVHPLMMIFATGMVALHTRKYRRNLLFGFTLAMLVMVLIGSVLIGDWLARRPVVFAIYWLVCFVFLFAVLALAFYDLMRVRSEHRAEIRRLDARMKAEMEKLRAEAKAELELSNVESADDSDISIDELRKTMREHDEAMGEGDQP